MTMLPNRLSRRLWRRSTRSQEEQATRGQALVEFAFGLPLMLLIMAGTLDVGQIFIDYVALRNGCHEGASYAARYPGESFDDDGPIRDRIEATSPLLDSGNLGVAVEYSHGDFNAKVTSGATVTVTCEREYEPITSGVLQPFGFDTLSLRAVATARIPK